MSRDVFITCAIADRTVAERVCELLESHGIGCWIAPRDTGELDFVESRTRAAIERARLVILILSSRTSASDVVLGDVRAALERDIPLLPLRIEDVWPTGRLAEFIDRLQFFDAFQLPLEQHRRELIDRVTFLRDRDRYAQSMPPTSMPPARRVDRLGLARALLLGVGLFFCGLLILGYFGLSRIGAPLPQLAPPPLSAPPGPETLTPPEENVIHLGNDLAGTPAIAHSYDDCGLQCIRRNDCVAFSFVASYGACYLKSTADGKTTQSGAMSGRIVRDRLPGR